MLETGRLCIKTAGKDAGKTVVIVEPLDKNFVVIDGPVKRKRCNILHLEPTQKLLSLKKGASHADVVKEFKRLSIDIPERKTKKTTTPKPRPLRATKKQPPEAQKEKKKPEAKEEKKAKKSPKAAKKA